MYQKQHSNPRKSTTKAKQQGCYFMLGKVKKMQFPKSHSFILGKKISIHLIQHIGNGFITLKGAEFTYLW